MSSAVLRAIVFDFNGVIADDEVPHFVAFQQALRENGIALGKRDYYETYLGMDERNCVAALVKSLTGRSNVQREHRILQRKADLFRNYSSTHKPPLFRGAIELVKQAAARYRLAIASGGRREQILFALAGTQIEDDFPVIVSADETVIGKPDPGIYHLTLKLLNGQKPQPLPSVRPEETLVIEDSLAGIRAGLSAGMKVAAVASTYSATELSGAHLVVASLEELSVKCLESLFS
jgi:beta-phosphoglucomutase